MLRFLFYAMFFLSCGSSSKVKSVYYEQVGEPRISVSSGGKEISELDRQLVQRIEVKKELLTAFYAEDNKFKAPFLLKKEIDPSGKVMGLRLFFINNAVFHPSILGFEERDLLTAVGKKLLLTASDFEFFVSELKNNGQASLTLERNFLPYKFLYYRHD